jgi:DNA-binding CsgD family transcriptional regulator
MFPQGYVFCDRTSGSIRFRVDPEADGSLPVEKAGSLLAMHCLVRGQSPDDYEMMVVSEEPLLPCVTVRAHELLSAARSLGAGVKISRREQEVLDGVLKQQANKEIAMNLKVSERTVKFHVSSLLEKFGVTNRVALTREVQMGRVQSALGQPGPQGFFGFSASVPFVDARPAKAPASTGVAPMTPQTRRQVLPMPRLERSAV